MSRFVGLNNTGSEKGAIPGTYGTDYRYDSQATLDYLAGLGCPVVRIMFRWERIQLTLGAALASTELTRVTDYVTRAGLAGMRVILTVNKGARYNEIALGDAGGPTQADFVDLWDRISEVFKNNKTVLGYDNNEPHDLPDSFASFVNVATFDVNTEGWTSEGGSGVTTSRSTTTVHDGSGSLQCTKTVAAGSFQSLRVTDNVTTTHDEHANGTDYACWVFCPAGETGWFAQIDITDSTGTNVAGTAGALTANAWNYVSDTFTAAVVGAMQRKIVQIHNLSPTAGSKTFHVDSIVQAIRYTGLQRWQDADRAAAAAVRANGDAHTWFAAGYGWAAADGWTARNGPPWHTTYNVVYDAHLYYDSDHSGTYALSYAAENTAAIGAGFASAQARALSWLTDYLGWVATYRVAAMVGETGWPDDTNWNTVGAAVLAAATGAGLSVLIWAVGEIEGTGYPLTPWEASGGVGTPVNSPNVQAPIVRPYLRWESGQRPAPVVQMAIGGSTTLDPAGLNFILGTSQLGVGTLGSIAWVDVSADVTAITTNPSPGGPTDSASPGSATLTLENFSGWYDPENPGSPYAIDVGQHVRVWVPDGGYQHQIFYGYIDDITTDYGWEPSVTFVCSDGLAVLGRVFLPEITPQYDGDRTDQRIDRILTEAAWPLTLRTLETGLSFCQDDTYGDWALALLQRVVDTELGEHYVDDAGRYVFLSRTHIYTAGRSLTVQAVFSDTGTDVDMTSVGAAKRRGELFNQARLTREGGTEQFYEDAVSRARYGPQTYPRSAGTLLRTDADAESLTRWIVARFKDPGVKIGDLSTDATTQGMWDVLLPLRRYDRIRVIRDYGPFTIDRELLIDGIGHSITHDSWQMNITTRPTDYFDPFRVGTSQLGTGVLA